MLKKVCILLFIHLLCVIHVFAELRTFNDIFPNLSDNIRSSVFSSSGYVKSSQRITGIDLLGSSNSGARINPQIINTVMSKNPGYLVESILVITEQPGDVTLLDVYNALRNIRDLKGRLYDSATRNQAVPLFEDATRIVSEKQNTPIPDPPPAQIVPSSETVFIRLKDVNFGNSFYRGEMVLIQNGLRYTLSNFRNMTYFLIPVIREGKFIAQLYFEPIQEGILIYSIAGADVSELFASRIHMNSAISKRLAVIISWAVDGISAVKK